MNSIQIKRTSDTELLSSTITWLRFPLMAAVVFAHINPNTNMQLIDYHSLKWMDLYCLIATLGTYVITQIVVPCFFMFSGYLYFYKLKEWNKDFYLEKTKSRFRTLVIPYIIWNLMPILAYTLLYLKDFDGSSLEYLKSIKDAGIFKVFWNFHVWGTDLTNLVGWSTPINGPYNLPLWFLRDLIVIQILSPIIYYFIRYTRLYGIIILGIAYYTGVWLTIPGFSISCFFFFSLGAYFSINNKNFVTELNKNKRLWLSIMVISMFIVTFYENTELAKFFYPIFAASGMAGAIIIVSHLLSKGKIKAKSRLSKTSFFIYVTHYVLIINYSNRIINYLFRSENAFIAIVKYFGSPLITIGFCISMYYLLKKITPGLLNILLGGR